MTHYVILTRGPAQRRLPFNRLTLKIPRWNGSSELLFRSTRGAVTEEALLNALLPLLIAGGGISNFGEGKPEEW